MGINTGRSDRPARARWNAHLLWPTAWAPMGALHQEMADKLGAQQIDGGCARGGWIYGDYNGSAGCGTSDSSTAQWAYIGLESAEIAGQSIPASLSIIGTSIVSPTISSITSGVTAVLAIARPRVGVTSS